ncbi:MAG: AAA family ATPase [Haloarculaceae archaeon]
MTAAEGIELRVAGARKRDAGRGIARLPESVRTDLGVLSGDPVVVEGDHLAVAKVWPEQGADRVIRIDADTRNNAGVTIGDTVLVHRADVSPAARVTLQPVAEGSGDLPEETLARRLRDGLVRTGERLRAGDAGPFVVTGTSPDGSVRVTEDTTVELQPHDGDVPVGRSRAGNRGGRSVGDRGNGTTSGSGDHRTDGRSDGTPDDAAGSPDSDASEAVGRGSAGTTYEDIGGLEDELDLVRETIELPLAEPEVFDRLNLDPPSGVLLHGPPGTGKTLIARAVANEVDASFRSISGPEIVSKYKGESEERLREAFEEAQDNAPAILFVDEIDSIAGSRDAEADMENRVVAQLLTLMDGLQPTAGVVVVGATNRVDTVDEALRRGGRFDREIEIGVPDERGRREILAVHTRGMPMGDGVDLDRLAARTHGFVGADVASLVREAAMAALRRDSEGLRVTRADFETALAAIEPSAMREYVAESPRVTFADVGGLEDAKDRLREAVEWPLEYGPLFESTETDPPTGILLHGPPGTGKTLLARATAGESGVNFLRVAGPELLDRYVGESEKAVRELFERARQTAPAIVFIDELDAVAGRRGGGGDEAVTERVVSQLLAELDDAAENPALVVLAATNRREAIDEALLRPGRLEVHVAVPDPDEAGRRAILAVHVSGKPLGSDVDLDALAGRTEGFSGADLEALVREASMRAIRDVAAELDPEGAVDRAGSVRISADHFEAAIERIRPD